jgi:hypothetical protein
MATKKDDAIDRLTQTIEGILDKREQRAKEEKDPQARFDRVMGRLEQFLDGQEKPKEKAKGEPKSGSGGIVSALFGEEETG